MKKNIFIIFGVLLLSGCTNNPIREVNNMLETGVKCILALGCESAEAYRVSLPYSMDEPAWSINSLIKPYINKRKPAQDDFINDIRNIKFVDEWLD